MLAIFCLRLALGLAGSLLVLRPADVAPRFYRTQFLIILGLLAGATFFFWTNTWTAVLLLLGVGMLFSFAGSVVWMLESAPGSRALGVLTLLTLALASAIRWGLLYY